MLTPGNQYSLAKLVIEPVHDYVTIKITFEEINNIFETVFAKEIL